MVDAAEDTLEAIQERDILAQDDQADNTSLHRTEHIEGMFFPYPCPVETNVSFHH